MVVVEPSFDRCTRAPSTREQRWFRLKFARSRDILRKSSRLPVGCLCVAIPTLILVVCVKWDMIWVIVMAIVCSFALLSLNGKRRFRKELDRLEARLEVGLVQETHIVSSRCFEVNVEDDGDALFQTFFDVGGHSTVTTLFKNTTEDPSYRTFRLFPYEVSPWVRDGTIRDLRYSIVHLFPNSDFVFNRFEIEGKFVCGWIRCRGHLLTPLHSIFSSDSNGGSDEIESEIEGLKNQPVVIIPKPFDECLLEALPVE